MLKFLKYAIVPLSCMGTHIACAATVVPLDGKVFYNDGSGYQSVKTIKTLLPGDTVMVTQQGKARLEYFEGCSVTVVPGKTVVVSKKAPCSAIETSSTSSSKSPKQNPYYLGTNNTPLYHENLLGYVVGGATVAGIITGAVLGFSDNSASGE